MPAKSHDHEPLIFAWNAKDHSSWHLVLALLVLMGAMAGFFVVFRIVHPVSQRLPTTPQRVIALDPADPAALALIHRAQDRSFALLSDATDGSSMPVESGVLAFKPSFEGYQMQLREMPLPAAVVRAPNLFTPGVDVLPPVPPRAVEPVAAPANAVLHAVMSSPLAKRGPASVELSGIALTQPTRVQFRVAVGPAGQIITALPLGGADDAAVMSQLYSAVSSLRFNPAETKRIEWGEVSFRWEVTRQP